MKQYPSSFTIRDIKIAPAVVLAPMEGITNIVFRRLIREIGGTGLTYTEFIPSVTLANRGKHILRMAEFDPDEYPIAIQIFGRNPYNMAEAAKVVQDLGASIVDINMGCPSKQVCANSGGSALMREPELALEIVRKVKQAITIPLTVKMRAGFDHSLRNAPDLAYACQEEGAEAITVHWRTKQDLYRGVQEWDTIAKVKERVSVPVIGNGDIIDVPSAKIMFEKTNCDGLMIGRGAIKNPWVLLELASFLKGEEFLYPSLEQKKDVLLRFLNRYNDFFPEKSILGKFKQIAKYFCEGLPNAQGFRKELLRSQSTEEAERIIHNHFDSMDV